MFKLLVLEAMILVSSFRPFKEDPEWDRNQLTAFRTWMMFAKRIILFGQHEPDLSNNKVSFVPSEQFPRIKDMIGVAAKQRNQFVAICNGDILLNPSIIRIEGRMKNGHYKCASSRRWHFDPAKPMAEAMESASLIDADGRDDRGRDVFIARADAWDKLLSEAPDHLRVGHQHWDAWLTDAFRRHWDAKFLDFTALRIVHHPHHQGRRMPYATEITHV